MKIPNPDILLGFGTESRSNLGLLKGEIENSKKLESECEQNDLNLGDKSM